MPPSFRLNSRRLRLEDYHLLLCVDDIHSPIGSRLCVDRDWEEGVALLQEGLTSGRYRDLQQVTPSESPRISDMKKFIPDIRWECLSPALRCR